MANDPIVSFIPENDEAFRRALIRLGRTTNDFRVPFGLIAAAWYQSNKIIFSLKGPGKYEDYVGERGDDGDTDYMRRKRKFFGGKTVYPLLFLTGRLASSLLNRSHPEAELFIGKQILLMGTSVPYTIYHQSDRPPKSYPERRFPQRKPIFISGGPAEDARDANAGGRLNRWLNIINDHVVQLINEEGFEAR